MLTIGIIGMGTLGKALALCLSRAGYQVVAVSSRRLSSAQLVAKQIDGCIPFANPQPVADASGLVFITTPDDAIAFVVDNIRWYPNRSVVHCSGADPVDILDAARSFGASTGVFHPLRAFATVEDALEDLRGTTFAIEAEPPLANTLRDMAISLGGQPLELQPEDKALYHLSAVIASNYLVTLAQMASELWKSFGKSQEEAIEALIPLMRSTVNNLKTAGLPDALTGPIARGDWGTISKHLRALSDTAPHFLPAYRELGLATIPVALAKGKLSEEKARELRSLLQQQDLFVPAGKKKAR